MNKLISALVATVFAAASVTAFAQDKLPPTPATPAVAPAAAAAAPAEKAQAPKAKAKAKKSKTRKSKKAAETK